MCRGKRSPGRVLTTCARISATTDWRYERPSTSAHSCIVPIHAGAKTGSSEANRPPLQFRSNSSLFSRLNRTNTARPPPRIRSNASISTAKVKLITGYIKTISRQGKEIACCKAKQLQPGILLEYAAMYRYGIRPLFQPNSPPSVKC